MTQRAVGHQHPQPAACNIEVVVIVHAARTTTSEESQLGIITCSKRESITSETSHHEQTDCIYMFNNDCPKLPTTLEEEGAEPMNLSSSFEMLFPAETDDTKPAINHQHT